MFRRYGNPAAEAENATAPIEVWWDMKGCPVPEGYDAGRVRPSLEAAFKKLGYSGPVSITAYGDHKQTPDDHLRGLSSTGVSIAHTKPESICSLMYSDMLEWRAQNPPPATMMLISDQVEEVFSWDLARLQQATMYNLFVAYPSKPQAFFSSSDLETGADWLWNELLELGISTESCSELSAAMFYCKSCCFRGQSLKGFRKHLSSRKHAVQEVLNRTHPDLDQVTRKWGKNYAAEPEYATAPIGVWWDMDDCPIPEGYDARQVRASIEAAFKKLGYSGPVSITAYGDHKQTPDDHLRGLSSTGVALAQTIPEVTYKRMGSDMREWRDQNPPPATMMLISDYAEHVFSGLTKCQSCSLVPSGFGKAYLQRQEDTFFASAVKVKGVVNLPKCSIANCAFVIAKALMVSGTISQLVPNMNGKSVLLERILNHTTTIESNVKRRKYLKIFQRANV
ncbi:unnamed protein product [Microthlaspi erraticum]|uniref:NYN domain-containing protein n=1 Tax=Microthlaspi erraticum TaxID=1685480 RepID=A0A6D2IJU9_9BRAS|nr:unnamed protein product [Microthlaspi erraticum]